MEDFSCQICFEAYTENGRHEPRLCPCGHTLCGTCITNLLTNSRMVAYCPFCKCVLPRTGDSFPKNFEAITLIPILAGKIDYTGCKNISMDTNKLESDIKMDSYLVEHLSSDLRNYQSLIAHTEAQLQSLRSIANAAQQQLQEAQERLSASCGVKAGVEAIVRSRDMSQSEQDALWQRGPFGHPNMDIGPIPDARPHSFVATNRTMSSGASRGELLRDIRSGTRLNQVSRWRMRDNSSHEGGSNMFNQLRAGLTLRRREMENADVHNSRSFDLAPRRPTSLTRLPTAAAAPVPPPPAPAFVPHFRISPSSPNTTPSSSQSAASPLLPPPPPPGARLPPPPSSPNTQTRQGHLLPPPPPPPRVAANWLDTPPPQLSIPPRTSEATLSLHSAYRNLQIAMLNRYSAHRDVAAHRDRIRENVTVELTTADRRESVEENGAIGGAVAELSSVASFTVSDGVEHETGSRLDQIMRHQRLCSALSNHPLVLRDREMSAN